MGASWADCKSKKLSFWSVIFSYSVQQQRSDCDVQWKVDFIQPATTSSVIRPRRSSKSLPKAKLTPKKDQGHCVVVSCPCDSLQLSESRWNNYIWEVVQQINEMYWKLQSLQPALVNKKGLILLHDHAQPPDNNQCFKSGTNGAVEFCLILHIHLISHQLTTTSSVILTTFFREHASRTSRSPKMLSKSSLNPRGQIFML